MHSLESSALEQGGLKGLPSALFSNSSFSILSTGLHSVGQSPLCFRESRLREHKLPCPGSLCELGSQPGPSPRPLAEAEESRSPEVCIFRGREMERAMFRQPGYVK